VIRKAALCLFLVFGASFVSCTTDSDSSSALYPPDIPSSEQSRNESESDVQAYADTMTLRVEKAEYPAGVKEVTAIIENITDEETGYGEAYSVQLLSGGSWQYLTYKEDHYFIGSATILPARGTHTKTFSLERFDAEIKPGRYRLVFGEERSAADFINPLYAEFTVVE
jgi:hypothetical protein